MRYDASEQLARCDGIVSTLEKKNEKNETSSSATNSS
jgi:hypothetical protein